MKDHLLVREKLFLQVAPLVGAWIERYTSAELRTTYLVAPLVGAWIERDKNDVNLSQTRVAPLVGAWIERR